MRRIICFLAGFVATTIFYVAALYAVWWLHKWITGP